jgi:tRNA threonylcarbamoyladenosine biosynthesis protein TsaB
MAMGMCSLKPAPEKVMYCPMIDARRMEVYMGLYDHQNREIIAPAAEIITREHFISMIGSGQKVILAGDGAMKCKEILSGMDDVEIASLTVPSSAYMIPLAESAFQNGEFENTAYFEPYYLKDFIAGIPKVKGLR